MKVTIGDNIFEVGDKVWYGLNRGEKDEVTFTEGYVYFGQFDAEIYTVYGFYVGDEEGNQISEAGLDDQYIKIS